MKEPLSSATHPRLLFTSPYRINQGIAALKPSIPSLLKHSLPHATRRPTVIAFLSSQASVITFT